MRIKTISNFSKLLTLFLVTFAAVLFVPEANAATLSFSPASSTLSKDKTFNVRVNVNTGGEFVNAVQANFSYPTDKLQFVSISTGGSSFSIIAEKSGSNGEVRIAAGSMSPGVSGSKYLGSATFKVIAETGTASLGFKGDSQILRNSDNANIYTGGNASVVNISQNAVSEDDNNVDSKTSQNTAGGLAIKNITATDVDKNTATINWETTEEAKSTIEYGETNQYEFSVNDDKFLTNHSVVLDPELLAPGKKYFVKITGETKDGETVTDESFVLYTKGYSVIIKVLDEENKPVAGASVKVYSLVYEKETDENGEAMFNHLSLGTHGLLIKGEGKTIISDISVTENDEIQVFEKKFGEQIPFVNYKFIVIFGILSISTIVLILIVYLIYVKRKKGKVVEDTSGEVINL